jgi:hypothetical protein
MPIPLVMSVERPLELRGPRRLTIAGLVSSKRLLARSLGLYQSQHASQSLVHDFARYLTKKLRFPNAPVKTLDLVSQHRPSCLQPGWQHHLKRIPLDLGGERTK